MRKTILGAGILAVFILAGAAAPALAQQPPQGQPAAPPKPYKVVPIQLPKPLGDASFDAFRKQLAGIAQKKDRAALARVVSQNFFWIPEEKDIADKKKPGLDNLAKAIGLDGANAPGWDFLSGAAEEASAQLNPDRKGVVCGPAEPAFDEKAAEELAGMTQTDPVEWAYPIRDGVQVRAAAQPNAAPVERLGLHLVRILEDSGVVPGLMVRIVTPSGKLGYVPLDLVRPLITDQVCYVKEGNAWKIAGLLGGEPPPAQ